MLTVLLPLLARPLALLMQAPEEALDLTVTYIRICGGGIFFVIAYNVISGIFRGLGDSVMPLVFVAIACVVNILGDLFFVAVLHMNVAGAALATILAQAVSVILSLLIIRKRALPFTIKKSDFSLNSEVIRFVRIGAPISFQGILTDFSFLALCAFINDLGLDASSGYGVASKIGAFIMLVPGSLMQSMASFVSQNVGADAGHVHRHGDWLYDRRFHRPAVLFPWQFAGFFLLRRPGGHRPRLGVYARLFCRGRCDVRSVQLHGLLQRPRQDYLCDGAGHSADLPCPPARVLVHEYSAERLLDDDRVGRSRRDGVWYPYQRNLLHLVQAG